MISRDTFDVGMGDIILHTVADDEETVTKRLVSY